MSDPTHQAALMTSTVAALEAWPVQAPFGCRQRACQAAASASDVQSSGGRGRVDHRARSEKSVESAPEKVKLRLQSLFMGREREDGWATRKVRISIFAAEKGV